jgi:IS5 family transposase
LCGRFLFPSDVPIKFEITDGRVNDCVRASSLIVKLALAETIIADKGYDNKKLRK